MGEYGIKWDALKGELSWEKKPPINCTTIVKRENGKEFVVFWSEYGPILYGKFWKEGYKQ